MKKFVFLAATVLFISSCGLLTDFKEGVYIKTIELNRLHSSTSGEPSEYITYFFTFITKRTIPKGWKVEVKFRSEFKDINKVDERTLSKIFKQETLPSSEKIHIRSKKIPLKNSLEMTSSSLTGLITLYDSQNNIIERMPAYDWRWKL